jgi:hypothetical protein
MRKVIVGLVALAAIAAPLALAAPANAADGDTLFNADFEGGVTTLAGEGATTDFWRTGFDGQATGTDHPDGSMWSPGTYTIGTNPNAVHELWVDWSGATDNMLFVNGFTNVAQKVASFTVQGEVCETAGSNITFAFTANMANILPLDQYSDGGAEISVTINGTSIGSEKVLSNDPANVVEIFGSAPAAADGSLNVVIWNDGTAYSGNDFAIDDMTLKQVGSCEPPCETVVNGVWFNYTGKYSGTGTPALNDPKWHALPAQPGGEHALSVRGFDKPYNPGADKGKGDWFVWKDLGTTCPA